MLCVPTLVRWLIDEWSLDFCGQTVRWQISARPSPEVTVHGEPATEQRARQACKS